jgi:hypothetical protein
VEVAQAEFRRALAKDSFTWLSGLMALAARPFTVTSQNISIMIRKYLQSSSERYIINNISVGQKFSSIYKVGQNYHNFNLRKNYKDFKIWVTEKVLMIKLNIKDKSNNYLDNFKDIYRKISQLRNLEKVYGSLIMTSILNINPDLAITQERIYQDYIHECQILLVKVPSLAEKLAIYLIQRDQHWFLAHVNIDLLETEFHEVISGLLLSDRCIN